MHPLPPPLPVASVGLRTPGAPARDPDLLGGRAQRGRHPRPLCNCNAPAPLAKPTACVGSFCSPFPFALSGEANKTLLLSRWEVLSFSPLTSVLSAIRPDQGQKDTNRGAARGLQGGAGSSCPETPARWDWRAGPRGALGTATSTGPAPARPPAHTFPLSRGRKASPQSFAHPELRGFKNQGA